MEKYPANVILKRYYPKITHTTSFDIPDLLEFVQDKDELFDCDEIPELDEIKRRTVKISIRNLDKYEPGKRVHVDKDYYITDVLIFDLQLPKNFYYTCKTYWSIEQANKFIEECKRLKIKIYNQDDE